MGAQWRVRAPVEFPLSPEPFLARGFDRSTPVCSWRCGSDRCARSCRCTSILRCRREPKCTGGAQIQTILSEISPHRFVGLRSLVRSHRVGVLRGWSRIPREKPYFGFRCRRPFSRSSGVSAGMRNTREVLPPATPLVATPTGNVSPHGGTESNPLRNLRDKQRRSRRDPTCHRRISARRCSIQARL